MKKNKITSFLGLFLIAMVLPVTTAVAQGSVNALYLTADDFQRNQMTYPVTTNQYNKIEQQLGKKLLVYREGEPKKYKFGDVYGYCQDGSRYRVGYKRKWFSDYGFYKVLDDSGLVIYTKPSRHHRSNGYTWYYYSQSLTSEIKRLTEDNIEKDFSEYPEFIKAISELIKNNEENKMSNEGKLLINTNYAALIKK